MPLLRNKGAKLELILWAQNGDWLSPFIVGRTFTFLFIRRIRSAFRQLGDTPYHSELVAFNRIICFENTENKESQIQTTDVSRLRVNYAIHDIEP